MIIQENLDTTELKMNLLGWKDASFVKARDKSTKFRGKWL